MTIRVGLVEPSSRRFFLCRWKDPVTGRIKTLSTKTTIRRDAERFAGRLQAELNEGTYKPLTRTTWAEARAKFERARRSKAKKTQLKSQSMFNAMERLIEPGLVGAITSDVVADYAAALEDEGCVPATVFGHLAELRKFLRYCVRMNYIKTLPHIEFPEVIPAPKGRAITVEEFERILAVIPKATDDILPQFADGWRHYLQGLWLSGLRLEESMNLHWTDDRQLCVDLTGRRPMMRIQASAEKGRTFRLLPITPDFAEFLDRTPKAERRGYVFRPHTLPRGFRHYQRNADKPVPAHRPTHEHAGKVISRLGELAGVKVAEGKFASAHDFRRSFGVRWARVMTSQMLKEFMRHKSIKTTEQFYLGQMAEAAADEVWEAVARLGSAFGNTLPQHDQTPHDGETANRADTAT